NAAFFGAGEKHIQSAVTIYAIDRSEPLVLIAARIGAVGRRDEDNITFVALDVFKVLDEQGVLSALHPLLVSNGRRIVSEPLVEEFFNQFSLLKIKRDHAE